MQKAKITYRFDREAHPNRTGAKPAGGKAEEAPAGKVIPLVQEEIEFNRDYGSWKSAFDMETERIEREIRESGGRIAASGAEAYRDPENTFTYTSPEADSAFERTAFYEETPLPAYRRKSGGTHWFAAFSSLAGAILTGIVLGLFVLSIFRGDGDPQGEAPGNADQVVGGQLPDDKTGVAAIPDTGSAPVGGDAGLTGETVAVDLPGQTYYFVQNGVFSGREGADNAVDLLRQKGLSGAVESGSNGTYSVYAGTAATREDALLIGHHLQNEGLEIYIKPYVLPAVDRVARDGADDAGLREYIEGGRELAAAILAISTVRLGEAEPGPLTEGELADLERLHQFWTEKANALASAAPEPRKAMLEQMNTALNSAVMTLQQYGRKPTRAYLWQAQSAVSQQIIGQKAYLEAAAQ